MTKRTLLGLALGFVAVISGSGCSTMSHRNLQQDLPGNYLTAPAIARSAKQGQMVDSGFLWLPFIFGIRGQIWRTAYGYDGWETVGVGPFALLLRHKNEGRYGTNGKLVLYSRSSSLLWGILGRHHDGRAWTTQGWQEAGGNSILWGMFGHDTGYRGQSIIRFLFLPIYLKRAAPGVQMLDQR